MVVQNIATAMQNQAHARSALSGHGYGAAGLHQRVALSAVIKKRTSDISAKKTI
jgi:hypothetical protein